MSSLFVAAIIVGVLASIIFILVGIHNKHKREAVNSLLKDFSRLGTEHNLSFSGQEILNQTVLGFDGIQRKILVTTREEEVRDFFIIDLDEVKNCRVKKIQGTINSVDSKDLKPEQFLEKIVLHFDLHSKPSAQIVFYHNLVNHIYEAQELEQKAKHWESVFLKMHAPVKNIA